MDHKKYQNWVSGIDELTPPQKEQAQDLMSGVTGENASLMAIEAQLEESRQCPHCKASGAVSKGMARGMRRYQCKACKKTFMDLTNRCNSADKKNMDLTSQNTAYLQRINELERSATLDSVCQKPPRQSPISRRFIIFN